MTWSKFLIPRGLLWNNAREQKQIPYNKLNSVNLQCFSFPAIPYKSGSSIKILQKSWYTNFNQLFRRPSPTQTKKELYRESAYFLAHVLEKTIFGCRFRLSCDSQIKTTFRKKIRVPFFEEILTFYPYHFLRLLFRDRWSDIVDTDIFRTSDKFYTRLKKNWCISVKFQHSFDLFSKLLEHYLKKSNILKKTLHCLTTLA